MEEMDIEWGEGNLGKLGLKISSQIISGRLYEITVELYLWTKYVVIDADNEFFLGADGQTSIGSRYIYTTGNNAWSEVNKVLLAERIWRIAKGSDAKEIIISARGENVGDIGESLTVSKLIKIPATTKYNVTFEDGYGNVAKTQQVSFGGNAVPPLLPKRPGYKFIGWIGNYKNVQRDELVIAEWYTDKCELKYAANDGSENIVKAVLYEYGTVITKIYADVAREGYVLRGWAFQPDATEPDIENGDTRKFKITSNLVLYAVWKKENTLFIKIGNTYKPCKPYIKIDGVWKKSTACMKINGTWKRGEG